MNTQAKEKLHKILDLQNKKTLIDREIESLLGFGEETALVQQNIQVNMAKNKAKNTKPVKSLASNSGLRQRKILTPSQLIDAKTDIKNGMRETDWTEKYEASKNVYYKLKKEYGAKKPVGSLAAISRNLVEVDLSEDDDLDDIDEEEDDEDDNT